MIKRTNGILIIILISIVLTSCSGYNKLLKSKDFEKKYDAALSYYEKKDYFKAQQLFDELLVIYRGTPKAEQVFFLYAYTYYHLGDYITAAYQFQRYAVTFPKADKAEEAFFMSAYCKYLDSPKFSLDQTSTEEAISQLQTFINVYPASPRIDTCNMYIDELRLKLEKKAFEKAKLYHTTGYDRSAITALTLFNKKHPGSMFKEEALFLILDASYRYAVNSVASKQSDRLQEANLAYQTLVTTFPQTRYMAQANSIRKNIESAIAKTNSK